MAKWGSYAQPCWPRRLHSSVLMVLLTVLQGPPVLQTIIILVFSSPPSPAGAVDARCSGVGRADKAGSCSPFPFNATEKLMISSFPFSLACRCCTDACHGGAGRCLQLNRQGQAMARAVVLVLQRQLMATGLSALLPHHCSQSWQN